MHEHKLLSFQCRVESINVVLLNWNLLVHNDPSCWEREKKQTNEKAKYYSAFNCTKQMVAKLKEITYTLSSLYGSALIEAIITPTFPLYNEVN